MHERILYILLLMLAAHLMPAQNVPHCIEVIGRPSQDSIMLRWAPMTHAKWLEGNNLGYRIERYTLVRDNEVINPPEMNVLTQNPVTPWPLDAWEPLVNRDRYAAIAAQALYGGSFEIDMGKTDVFQIVNKAKENEQRYQFALFSADMSVAVARASGLLFTDKQINKGEKYLYRISIHTPLDTCRGSVYIGPDDSYQLPVITDVKAERKGEAVMLQWGRDKLNLYTAYRVERSENGKTFTPISDEAIINFSPSEQETSSLVFASDSVASTTSQLWYRVVGISPFGEYGPAGEPVEVTSAEVLETAPYIHSGYSEDNQEVTLQWNFPEKLIPEIAGFHVDRARSPKDIYKRLTTQLIPPTTRSFTDQSPGQVNYYRISAVSPKGRELSSPVYLVQLVDSIPPAAPVDLSAMVNEFGNISIRWKPNTDPDIYGYRIYRANYKGEELAQITHEPVAKTEFSDKVDLNTLNEKVYYQVMAIDRNQNHSALSDLLEVKLPDKVKPVSPVFYPVKTSEEGIALRWQPSSSDDVVQYDVYRQTAGEKQWIRVNTVPANGDSVYQYTDINLLTRAYHYTVLAIDDAGLESAPSQAVTGYRIVSSLMPAVVIPDPVIDREQKTITFAWTYEHPGVKSYMVFRSVGEGQLVLYRTIPPGPSKFTDKSVLPGEQYGYRFMAVFRDQEKSEMSKIITVTF